ncbi:MAG: 30S ribosomal protein S16 [Rickettsiaceae bacterium]|nr:MAG: 30S ribosomal protein S16 [Rickettsiaceae bacterium]
MTVKIRLARGGATNRPHYRVVVANATAPRDGDFIEKVGTYDPLLNNESGQKVILKSNRIEYWLKEGAQPTEKVAKFIEAAGIVLPMKIKKKMEIKRQNQSVKGPKSANKK